MTEPGTISWRQLWVESAQRLSDQREARWICEEASGHSGLDWLDVLDRPAGTRAVAHLDSMMARRLSGEPLAYVLGHWSFRTLELMVDRRVLIPRPETELVAQRVIELVRDRFAASGPQLVADLGTGSGAIALSIAAEIRPGTAEIWATDVSPDALDVARANLVTLPFRTAPFVRLSGGSWFDALPSELRGRLDVVVSNPPYVETNDVDLEESVRRWEPPGALFGGVDGLDAYRAVIGAAGEWLAPDGVVVVEIGASQGGAVAEVAGQHGFEAAIQPDLAGRDRIAVIRR